MSSPHLLLTGERLALGIPRQETLTEYHFWENDPATILGRGKRFPRSWEVRVDEWERQQDDEDHASFEIVRLKDKQPVGMTTLHIEPRLRAAEFTIVLAPPQRGKRYAEEATRLTLDWGFHLGALSTAWLRVLEPNRAGIVAFGKAGFRFAGRLRKSGHWLGQCVDVLLMDALPEDFPGPSAMCASLGS
ncbi:GNAT family N-acetyltransferase [Streptomyces sp. UNOC14_S4]|uniref:GNAT family N-acetyltransferase n=1 Tax=Streptomyces sp. UNOC14_S4 TaxID=2872340 RepID=UPI001E41019B|nr:GNAT family protein [Streptomyces sp. UNOC14_S4]MCC3768887.1 GNAT family N-acetyltransferase [Streptomyces sp. UNOC14_S4]